MQRLLRGRSLAQGKHQEQLEPSRATGVVELGAVTTLGLRERRGRADRVGIRGGRTAEASLSGAEVIEIDGLLLAFANVPVCGVYERLGFREVAEWEVPVRPD